MKYLITVTSFEKPFTTYKYTMNEKRIIFEDKFGNTKNFPVDSCFIEEVLEWSTQKNT